MRLHIFIAPLSLFFVLLWFVFGGEVVVEKTLKNGVKVILKETEGKGIVSGVVFVKGGQHKEKKRGETLLLFTMLLKGSERFPDSFSVSYPFEKYGGYVFSTSSDDFSEIGFSTKVEGLEEALEVLGDVLMRPLIKEDVLEVEKRNQVMALRSKLESGMAFAYEELRKLTYRGTPYETSPLGREEDVMSVRREDLFRRLGEIRRGKNVVVVLVGDFRAGEVLPLVERVFSEIPEGEFELLKVESRIKESEVRRVKRPGTQATILCAFNAPPKESDDYFAFKVFNSLLGEGMTSRLFRRLREEKGYAYATYSFYPTRYTAPRLFAYVGTSPQKKEDALRDLIQTVSEGDVKPEEVEIAKRKIVGDFLLDHETRLRQAWYLGFFEVMGFGWRMDEEYPKRIQRVSERDVESAHGRYIDFHHCVVVEP
ncbi:MAG: insulinase family protein [Aquificae bacterium]|nr:insulinase family protein [Aquificota bacterium]